MEKEQIKNFFSKLRIFKKYDYDINRVVGVKDNQRFILLAEKKLIRIYRDKLKSTPLLCSYIPIENAIFYSFEIEENVINQVDVDAFIETKVYEEAGLLESEKYLIKYEIVRDLKEDNKVVVQCVIVSVNFIEENYEYILSQTGYLDYLSFPAFAYKSLYEEGILKKGNDLFVIVLFDKIFVTFYSEGKLIYINTLTGGLNQIYEDLKSLNIVDFNLDVFKKLLTKKGVDKHKYVSIEMPVFEILNRNFDNIAKMIEDQMLDLVDKYMIENVDRIFITTEYGSVPGLNQFYRETLNRKVLGFEFYEDYNLDRLDIDPFLFLAMLDTHDAYKKNNLKFNFSLYLRKPTIWYRPSGIIIFSVIASILAFSIYPLYLYVDGSMYEKKSKALQNKLNRFVSNKNSLKREISTLDKKIDFIKKIIQSVQQDIDADKELIEALYKFKFEYLPKSQEMVVITKSMNRYNVYLENLEYSDGAYVMKVYSYNDENLGKLIDELMNLGFNVYFSDIKRIDNKFYTTLRVEE